jgi:sulfur relay (sulfurtransferase) DsrF/TusC family protein
MTYLMIESQGPWAGPNAGRFVRDAVELAESGTNVVLLLVQDGVLTALDGANDTLDRLRHTGVAVWVDEFSLRQRALPVTRLAEGAAVVDMDAVAAELLAEGGQAVWH